jgi:hypothetical protein
VHVTSAIKGLTMGAGIFDAHTALTLTDELSPTVILKFANRSGQQLLRLYTMTLVTITDRPKSSLHQGFDSAFVCPIVPKSPSRDLTAKVSAANIEDSAALHVSVPDTPHDLCSVEIVVVHPVFRYVPALHTHALTLELLPGELVFAGHARHASLRTKTLAPLRTFRKSLL